MTAYYISNLNSNFYQSSAFDLSINYMKDNFKTTSLAEVSGKRRMTIIHVYSVDEALNILNKIKG